MIKNRVPITRILIVTMAVIFAYALSYVGMGHAEASSIELRPDATGRIRIDYPILVEAGDTLSVPAGTTVEFKGNGSIFVRGRLDLGMTPWHGSSTRGISELARGTRITYSGSMVPIAVRGGTLAAFNVNFSGEKFLNAFQGASVFISSSTIETEKSGAILSVYQDSSIDIQSSVLRSIRRSDPSGAMDPSGYALIEIFSSSNATMTDMRIESPWSSVALAVYNQSRLRVDDSRFINCHTGIATFNGSGVRGVGNSFACAVQSHTAYNGSSIDLLEKRKECCARVIFVPGLQGSRLYRKESYLWFGAIPLENQLWEPDSMNDVRKLFLNASGTSILSGIYSRNIIDRINIFGSHDSQMLRGLSPSIYSGFIAYLRKLKNEKIIDGHVTFPYDWRMGLREARDSGLADLIRREASLASNEKVILISHSFGGFLVKDALSTLEVEGKKDVVQAVIYAAFPETGAPQAVFAGIHGDRQSILHGFIMDFSAAIRLAANMPSAHLLTPSMYFAGKIAIEFMNKKTGEKSSYTAGSGTTGSGHSLTGVHSWLLQRIRSADRQQGQQYDSPAIQKLSVIPSQDVGRKEESEKNELYGQSAVLENAFRTYSIIGIGLPTPIGMLYRYDPCVPPMRKSFSDFGSASPCLNSAVLTRVTGYSGQGDGVVAFDGKNRRSGSDSLIALAGSNFKNNAAIGHSDFMESPEVQRVITAMIKATSSPASDPFYDSASGTGSDLSNPWIHTGTVNGLDISGFVEGAVNIHVPGAASTTSIAPLQIITLNQAQKIQKISGMPPALAVTTATNSADGWSFGSAGTYNGASLRSLADQSVSITFSESKDSSAGSTGSGSSDSGTGGVTTRITESFSDIDIGFGSIVHVGTQYVTEDPSHVLVIDVDADGKGDIHVFPDKPQIPSSGEADTGAGVGAGTGGSLSGSSSMPVMSTYESRKSAALSSIHDAMVSLAQLEMYPLRRSGMTMLTQAERFIRAGNPTFALLAMRKRQARLADIAAQYGRRLERIQNSLILGAIPGVRSGSDRARKEAEIRKIQAYLRDLARLKIILRTAEQKVIDLLS